MSTLNVFNINTALKERLDEKGYQKKPATVTKLHGMITHFFHSLVTEAIEKMELEDKGITLKPDHFDDTDIEKVIKMCGTDLVDMTHKKIDRIEEMIRKQLHNQPKPEDNKDIKDLKDLKELKDKKDSKDPKEEYTKAEKVIITRLGKIMKMLRDTGLCE